MAMQTIPLTDVETRLTELVDRANELLERFTLTREGKAEAVLLSADDFEGLLETLDILSDTELVKRLVQAEEELAHGGGHSLEAVRERIRSGHGPAFEPG
jgi:prevent-host-death family protein